MEKPGEFPSALPFEAARPEEVLPLLQSGVSRKARLQCWSPGRKYSYTSRIVKVHETAGLISISISKEFIGGDAFEEGLLKEAVGEILFSLHLPTDVTFFKGELRKGDRTFFSARIVGEIYKVQRRQALRLPTPGSSAALVAVPGGGNYSAELLNVSEGGVALVVREKSDYEAISAFKDSIDLTFTAFGILVVAKALVKHGSEIGSPPAKKSYRLGLAFSEIDPKLRTQLSQLVFEESAKYMGRF